MVATRHSSAESSCAARDATGTRPRSRHDRGGYTGNKPECSVSRKAALGADQIAEKLGDRHRFCAYDRPNASGISAAARRGLARAGGRGARTPLTDRVRVRLRDAEFALPRAARA